MKNLKLISFVGIDEKTILEDILKMESVVPYEFGVLFSDSKSLTNHIRYPNYKFCKEFLEWGIKNNVQTSLHLCGTVIERFLNKEKDVLDLCADAGRIQLNLNIKEYPDHEDLSSRIWSVQKFTGYSIILQQNKTKEKFMQVFLKQNTFPISLLHDGSGGFGREITQTVPPDDRHFTGYAGGIKPENVSKIVGLIENNNPNNRPYYIDMESGVRVDNVFSIEKCKEVINNLL